MEFVIGVTGHRDIAPADADAVRASVTGVLQNLRDRFRHIAVTLVTGLAEGADTIAAEAALELGIGVTAILPMPLKQYENDFEGEALVRLRALLGDERVRSGSLPLAGGRDTANMRDQKNRDIQYRLLADYLSRRANVILTVWDGEVNNLPGGTADAVMRFLSDGSGDVPMKANYDPAPNEFLGNVAIWIPARRAKGAAPSLSGGVQYLATNSNHDCYWQYDEIPQTILDRWAGFDGYAAERASETGTSLDGYGLAPGGKEVGSADLVKLDAEYIRADQLARSYQRRSHKMFALFGFLAAGMGLAFLVYAKLLAAKAFLVIYIVLFLLGFAGFRYSARHYLHSRHLAYRALAETLRVQFFLVLSGAGEGYRLRRILALTSVDRFERFDWLPDAIRCAEPLVYSGHYNEARAIAAVRERWIDDQSVYFRKKLRTLHGQHGRLERIKALLLLGSVAGALALILFKKVLLHLEMAGYDGKAWLVFFMGLLPLWAAIWELYQGKMATRELLWQYSNQQRYFGAASREISQVTDLAECRRIMRDLANKALMEVYLWNVHRYHREHEPPSAG
jgi:hypothetical protein